MAGYRLVVVTLGYKYRKYKAPVERTPSLILLAGVADLEKFALTDPKTLFAVFGMPFISAHS